MVSVNGTLQVDLFAQANAARVHGMIYSGFGGQTDFVVGAVTSFQHSFIVSEQGTAAIWGHDASSQADQIVGQVAHPSVREELRQAARDLGFAGDWSREGCAFSPADR